MKIKIKPTYIIAFAVIACGALGTAVAINSTNSMKDTLTTQLAEQKEILFEQQEIIDAYNVESQEKLNGLIDGQKTLNQNDQILNEKIDAVGLDLGMLREDVTAFKQSLSEMEVQVANNHEYIVGELKGLATIVDNLRKAGYNKVSGQDVIDYNRCVAKNSAPATCNAILD